MPLRTILLVVWALAAASPAGAGQAEQDPPREPTRLYVGMWTTHLKHDVMAFDNNWAIGLSSRGYFGATFLNSFGRRAYTAGIQRTIVATAPRLVRTALGVRLGVASGYDDRLTPLAREAPILPFIQPFATIDIHRVGFEVSYTFVIVSVAVSYRL